MRKIWIVDQMGHQARVVDSGFFEFSDLFRDKQEQITRVEEHSDAYHLKPGGTDVMVAYLVEVTRKGAESLDTR